MNMYRIHTTQTRQVLFEGKFISFKACLERAIQDRINLRHADLKNTNLMNANLDDAQLSHADFSGANLTGANLSESELQKATYINSVLYNTCLAYSDLRQSNFDGASFGATDITGCDISFSRFSTLSCFSLDFFNVKHMRDCCFVNHDGILSRMSRPPVVIRGLQSLPVVFMDRHIRTTDKIITDQEIIHAIKQRLFQA